MNYRAPSEVEGAQIAQPTANSPHPMGQRSVDERRPSYDENHEGAELDALSECASYQRWRNDGELRLKHHKSLVRDRIGVGPGFSSGDPVQTQPNSGFQ